MPRLCVDVLRSMSANDRERSEKQTTPEKRMRVCFTLLDTMPDSRRYNDVVTKSKVDRNKVRVILKDLVAFGLATEQKPEPNGKPGHPPSYYTATAGLVNVCIDYNQLLAEIIGEQAAIDEEPKDVLRLALASYAVANRLGPVYSTAEVIDLARETRGIHAQSVVQAALVGFAGMRDVQHDVGIDLRNWLAEPLTTPAPLP